MDLVNEIEKSDYKVTQQNLVGQTIYLFQVMYACKHIYSHYIYVYYVCVCVCVVSPFHPSYHTADTFTACLCISFAFHAFLVDIRHSVVYIKSFKCEKYITCLYCLLDNIKYVNDIFTLNTLVFENYFTIDISYYLIVSYFL